MKKIMTVTSVCAMVAACGGEPDQVDVFITVEAPDAPVAPPASAPAARSEEAVEEEAAPEEEASATPRPVLFPGAIMRPNEGRMAPTTSSEPAIEEVEEEDATEEEASEPEAIEESEEEIELVEEPAAEQPEVVVVPPVEEPIEEPSVTPPTPVVEEVEEVEEEPELALSCSFVMQQELPVITGFNSIAAAPGGFEGSPQGFFVYGDSLTEEELVTPSADSEPLLLQPAMELQYWDLASMEGKHAYFAGQGTEFVGKGSPNNDFVAMVRWPDSNQSEPYNGIQPYLPPVVSSFTATGERFLTAWSDPWGEEDPWQGLVRSVETDRGPRLFWINGSPESDEWWTIRSSTFEGDGRFGPVGVISYIQPLTYDLRVDTSGSYIGTVVSSESGSSSSVHIWTEESAGSYSRDFGGINVVDFFGAPHETFVLVWTEVATGNSYVSTFAVSPERGMIDQTVLLPSDIVRIAPFNDGFVAITANPDDTTSFLFQRFLMGSQELELVESISFGADFDIYPLRTGDFVEVSEGTFAFTWSGVIGGERSNIVAFQCE